MTLKALFCAYAARSRARLFKCFIGLSVAIIVYVITCLELRLLLEKRLADCFTQARARTHDGTGHFTSPRTDGAIVAQLGSLSVVPRVIGLAAAIIVLTVANLKRLILLTRTPCPSTAVPEAFLRLALRWACS